MLFDCGFIRILADLALANIDDYELCQSSSFILSSVRKSLELFPQLSNFFSEIKGFELISKLLIVHRSNEEICSNTIFVLVGFLLNSKEFKIPKEALKTFFESGALTVISSLTESSNSFLALSCKNVFSVILRESTNNSL